jgi:hypothetical protein
MLVSSAKRPRPVITQVPALRMAPTPLATSSPVVTPTHTMQESAPWPLVKLRASSAASSMVSTAWVAPNRKDASHQLAQHGAGSGVGA